MSEEIQVDKDSRELQILVGLRSLLGDSKAQKWMVAFQQGSTAYAREIMAEAQARYDALSIEERENPEKILVKLSASTIRLRFKLILKLYPKTIWWLLKRLNPFAPKD